MEVDVVSNGIKLTDGMEVNDLINYITNNENICFKSQQRDEEDITAESKYKIALELFEKSKPNFLARFGKFCKPEHLEYFKQYSADEKDGYEITFYLKELDRYNNEQLRRKDVKNRRYRALEQMKTDTTYFSEVEMMRRNPLLYEHLVGQYLSESERKERDKLEPEDCSFANILLEGYQREKVQELKHAQEDIEHEMETESDQESDDSEETKENKLYEKFNVYSENNRPCTSKDIQQKSRWGEWEDEKERKQDEITNSIDTVRREKNWYLISDQEKRLLKKEFESHMFQNFLNGKDENFDYSTVDEDTRYDNIDVKDRDDEEKYFDSESPEECQNAAGLEGEKMEKADEGEEDSSEDELDVFMRRLNDHPTISQLSEDLKKM